MKLLVDICMEAFFVYWILSVYFLCFLNRKFTEVFNFLLKMTFAFISNAAKDASVEILVIRKIGILLQLLQFFFQFTYLFLSLISFIFNFFLLFFNAFIFFI